MFSTFEQKQKPSNEVTREKTMKIEEPEQPPAIEDQIDDFGLKY
jgi:hypothetical protein